MQTETWKIEIFTKMCSHAWPNYNSQHELRTGVRSDRNAISMGAHHSLWKTALTTVCEGGCVRVQYHPCAYFLARDPMPWE